MSRHTKPADDSCRLCLVVSNAMRDGIRRNVRTGYSTSDVVRGYIADGIIRDDKRRERANERAKRGQGCPVLPPDSSGLCEAPVDSEGKGISDKPDNSNV